MRQAIELLRRRKWVFIIPFAVVFLVPVIYSFIVRTYESSSLVWLDSSLSTTLQTAAQGNQTPVQTLADMFDQMLESGRFVTAVVEETSLASEDGTAPVSADTIDFYRDNVEVKVVGPTALRITCSGRSPDEALSMAQATTSEFISWVKGDAGQGNTTLLDYFTAQSDAYRQQVEQAQGALDSFVRDHPEVLGGLGAASPAVQEEYRKLQLQVELAKEIQTAYDSSLQGLVSDQAASVAQDERYAAGLRVVDEPARPTSYSKRRMLLTDVIALMAAALLGGTGVALAELTDRTIRVRADVEGVLGAPVLAEVPPSGGGGAQSAEPDSLFSPGHRDQAAAHYGELVARLLVAGEAEPFTVAVTSSVSGEGVSTVCADLALALATSTTKDVVLVDANMKRPALHALLGLPIEPGLRDLIQPKETAGWRRESTELFGGSGRNAMQTPVPNLWFLPSGAATRHTARLTTSEDVGSAIESLRARFDYVVIDCPAVLSGIEATSLCRSADGVLVVVRAGSTERESLRRTRESLQNASITGAVLNGAG